MFYTWLICLGLFIVFSSIAIKQGIEEEQGKTFKSSVFFAAGNFIFFFISIFIPLLSKKVYWAWGLIPLIFKTPLGFLFYIPLWKFLETFKDKHISLDNKREKFLKELSDAEKQFEQQTNIYIPQVFERLKNIYLKIEDNNELWQLKPKQAILNALGSFCYREIDFNPETKIYPGLLSPYGNKLKALYLFCVKTSFENNFFSKEEYDIALKNLQEAINDRNNA